MSSDIFEIIIPSVAFFLGFFLAYMLLEILVLLFLNRFFFRYWGISAEMIDIPRIQRNHRIELAICLFISFFILALIYFSQVIGILLTSTVEVRVFVLEIFLSLLLIYLITTHHLVKDDFIQKTHKYLFFYISSIVFIFTIILSNQNYENYKNYIHASIIHPLTANRSMILESKERRRLLTEFRQKIYSDLCPRVDFSTYYKNGRVVNFVYVVTHPDLKIAGRPIIRSNLKDYLSGRLCSNDKTSFLLTDHGQWYWVIEGQRIAKK
ncbi:hypothetical protein HZA41_03205 [Candidatus Peregrinibacteria bacterium]|nr:hypothetical protein [Candidatus Peregrinibacteria bacterium]